MAGNKGGGVPAGMSGMPGMGGFDFSALQGILNVSGTSTLRQLVVGVCSLGLWCSRGFKCVRPAKHAKRRIRCLSQGRNTTLCVLNQLTMCAGPFYQGNGRTDCSGSQLCSNGPGHAAKHGGCSWCTSSGSTRGRSTRWLACRPGPRCLYRHDEWSHAKSSVCGDGREAWAADHAGMLSIASWHLSMHSTRKRDM